MAKYQVTHSCGHEATHQLYGPGKDRERKLDWLAGTLCTECWRAEKDAERTAANAVAAEENAAAALSTLTGSPKQIAWAESIRAPICAALRSLESKLNLDNVSAAAGEEMGDAFALVVDEVCGQAESKWWIENGQYIGIVNDRNALYYVSGQIKERGLAPLCLREIEENKARRAAEKEAARHQETELVFKLCEELKTSQAFSWNPDTDTVTATVAGHTIICSAGGHYATVTVDGAQIQNPMGLREILTAYRNQEATARHRRKSAAAADSLAGVQVTSVRKNKQSLTVRLNDGRDMTGTSSRSGWELDRVSQGGTMIAISPDHPEVERLTADAKAAHKAAGKVGA